MAAGQGGDALAARMDALFTRIAALERRVEGGGGRSGDQAGASDATSLPLPASSTPPSPIQTRLDAELVSRGVARRAFLRVPPDYYDHPLAWRAGVLSAPSVDHLCKTLCLENTRAREPVGVFAPDRLAALPPPSRAALARFFLVVIQYTARLDVDALNKGLRAAAGPAAAAPAKAFNLRLAPEEESGALTGYEHNAVTPVGVGGVLDGSVPLILASAVCGLSPPLFWMGGGEVDLKCGVDTGQFIEAYRPLVMDVTVPAGEGEGE